MDNALALISTSMVTVCLHALLIHTSMAVLVSSVKMARFGMENNASIAAIMEEYGILLVELVFVPVDLTGMEAPAFHVLMAKYGTVLRANAPVQLGPTGMDLFAFHAPQD